DPRCVAAWNNRAAARNGLNDPVGALADAERALQLDPRHAPAWNNRAEAHLACNLFAAAIADCEQALRLDPRMCEAYICRDNARYHLFDTGGLLDYRTAFTLDAARAAKALVSIVAAQVRRDAPAALADCS